MPAIDITHFRIYPLTIRPNSISTNIKYDINGSIFIYIITVFTNANLYNSRSL